MNEPSRLDGHVISCGRLVDGTGASPKANVAILMRQGLIEGTGTLAEMRMLAGPNATTIDAQDKTVLPGLIDGHVHIAWDPGDWSNSRPQLDLDMLLTRTIFSLQHALRCGITTIRDCGAPTGVTLRAKKLIADGLITAPRLLACGPYITTTAGHGAPIGLRADSKEELRQAVRQLCSQGADFIKIMATGGLLDPESNRRRAQYSADELRFAVEDAHRLNRTVVAHANATEGIRAAVQAGVDVIAHCNWLGTEDGTIDFDSEVAAEMVRLGTWIDFNIEGGITPLAKLDGRCQDWSSPGSSQNRWDVLAGLRQRVFFTSDEMGPSVAKFPGLLLKAMDTLGLPVEDLIMRSTGLPAKALGMASKIGTIEVGKDADLLLLDGDLVADPTALERVASVFVRGEEVVSHGLLAAPRPTRAHMLSTPIGGAINAYAIPEPQAISASPTV